VGRSDRNLVFKSFTVTLRISLAGLIDQIALPFLDGSPRPNAAAAERMGVAVSQPGELSQRNGTNRSGFREVAKSPFQDHDLRTLRQELLVELLGWVVGAPPVVAIRLIQKNVVIEIGLNDIQVTSSAPHIAAQEYRRSDRTLPPKVFTQSHAVV
jgi:hypothetical protein